MDEPIRKRIVTAIVVTALCCTGIGVRVAIQKVPVDSRAVFLPVVVMTMMIERFFVIIGKEGSKAAAYALLNSLIVAVCCFGLFAYTSISAALLGYLELLILSGLILIGCYSGPTLVGRLGLGKEATGETDD